MNFLKYVIIFIILRTSVAAVDYSFDLQKYQKKTYDFSFSLELTPEFIKYNKESIPFKLNGKNDNYDLIYKSNITFKGNYDFWQSKLEWEITDILSYSERNNFDNSFKIMELLLNSSWENNLSLEAGKKSLKWGKGYVKNPVAFASREKDINNTTSTLEGFWLLNSSFVKSPNSFIKNYSLTFTILPEYNELNSEFSKEEKNINYLLKTYFLIHNIDWGSYFLINSNNHKIGFDFAYNLLSNWEIHSEYAYSFKTQKELISENVTLKTQTIDTHDFLLGTRVLFNTNTTVILEFFHNDFGLKENETATFWQITEQNSYNNEKVNILRRYQKNNLNKQFVMQNYLYSKISQPEPFDMLYFTPSVFLLYNLVDKSIMSGLELKYSRFDNLNLQLKSNYFFGKNHTEYGEKLSYFKLLINLEILL